MSSPTSFKSSQKMQKPSHINQLSPKSISSSQTLKDPHDAVAQLLQKTINLKSKMSQESIGKNDTLLKSETALKSKAKSLQHNLSSEQHDKFISGSLNPSQSSGIASSTSRNLINSITDLKSLNSGDSQSIASMSYVNDSKQRRMVQILHPITTTNTLPSGLTSIHEKSIDAYPNSTGQFIVERRSLHELIEHIEINAKNNLSTPPYVPSLEQILQDDKNITWKKKLKKKKLQKHLKNSSSAETLPSNQKIHLKSILKPPKLKTDIDQNKDGAMINDISPRSDKSVRVSIPPDCESLTAPRSAGLSHRPAVLTRQMSGNSVFSGISLDSSMQQTSFGCDNHSQYHDKNMTSPVSLPVDIIGCHHPVQLILFKANERARRITNVRDNQQEIETFHRLSIEKSLQVLETVG